jgi:aspartyl-tRNA(Asn)/glutamyl-tRNA(Gln) amidotransferase subunit C
LIEVSKKIVQQVADLAHLELDEQEIAYYETRLSNVLKYVSKLDELKNELEPGWRGDTSGASTLERSDTVITSLEPEVALSQAPKKTGTAFQVPRIIE